MIDILMIPGGLVLLFFGRESLIKGAELAKVFTQGRGVRTNPWSKEH